jgi:hypothetical protein
MPGETQASRPFGRQDSLQPEQLVALGLLAGVGRVGSKRREVMFVHRGPQPMLLAELRQAFDGASLAPGRRGRANKPPEVVRKPIAVDSG